MENNDIINMKNKKVFILALMLIILLVTSCSANPEVGLVDWFAQPVSSVSVFELILILIVVNLLQK